MKRVINIILKKDRNIEKIRKTFGVDTKKILPHITIVCPFEIKDEKDLHDFIKESIEGISEFSISLEGLKRSASENYLYLLVKEGSGKIKKIYKRLHRGGMKKFKNKCMPTYIPHLSLGNFKNKKEFDFAYELAEKEKLFLEMKVKVIQLITLNKNNSIKKVEDFRLA